MSNLAEQHCVSRRGDHHRLPLAQAQHLMEQVPLWTLAADGHSLSRAYLFKDFVAAVDFVNALCEMAEAQDHHPDLEVGYGRCGVRYNTHDVGGLSLNDFICAARADVLYAAQTED